jgi:hypothetical protein
MTTVKEIEEAVEKLPKLELDKFRSWFEKFEAELWDQRFEDDVRSGKLDQLADRALKDFEEGRCTRL